jgi:hypothetical protein
VPKRAGDRFPSGTAKFRIHVAMSEVMVTRGDFRRFEKASVEWIFEFKKLFHSGGGG